MFFLFIGGTELSKVKGLSAAGANPEIVPITAPADAELMLFGEPRVTDHVPLDPEGHPTPAIITRAAVVEANIPCCTLVAGSYLPPCPPYVDLGAKFGQNPCHGPAVPDAPEVFEAARVFAAAACSGLRSTMIAESVPGGTTTALLILRALGYGGMVSSAGPYNPVPLKEEVWRQASGRVGIGVGGYADQPLEAVRQLGDPMQAAVLGFISGLPEDTELTLAGGTQMLAIAALLKVLLPSRKPLVATTKYVTMDKSSSFAELAEKIGVETYSAPLDFSASPYKGLSDYELGFIKEGVGAGGSVLYAERSGVSVERVIRRVNAMYEEMLAKQDSQVKSTLPTE